MLCRQLMYDTVNDETTSPPMQQEKESPKYHIFAFSLFFPGGNRGVHEVETVSELFLHINPCSPTPHTPHPHKTSARISFDGIVDIKVRY